MGESMSFIVGCGVADSSGRFSITLGVSVWIKLLQGTGSVPGVLRGERNSHGARRGLEARPESKSYYRYWHIHAYSLKQVVIFL